MIPMPPQERLILLRLKELADRTYGQFFFVRGPVILYQCCSFELPWHENQPNISRIPAGKYFCEPCGPTKIPYQHLAVIGVPNRSGIAIHRFNLVTQTEGCIGPGRCFADMDGDGVLDLSSSGPCLDRLNQLVTGRIPFLVVDAT